MKLFYLLAFSASVLLSEAKNDRPVSVRLHQSNYTGDTLTYLNESIALLEEIINSESFRSATIRASISNKYVGSKSLTNAEVLDRLLMSREISLLACACETHVLDIRILRSTKTEAVANGHPETAKAFAGPGSIDIKYVKSSLAHELSHDLKLETAATLLHEYMHILGFLHPREETQTGTKQNDVPSTYGDLAKRTAHWKSMRKSEIIGKWKWVYSLGQPMAETGQEVSIKTPDQNIVLDISKDGIIKVFSDETLISEELFFPIKFHSIERGYGHLPFTPEKYIVTKSTDSDHQAQQILLGQNMLSTSKLPHLIIDTNSTGSIQLFQNIFERMD